MNATSAITTLIIALVVAFVVFLVIRELVLWYFRLNQIANDIGYIADHYRQLERHLSTNGANIAQAVERQHNDEVPHATGPNAKLQILGIRPNHR